MLVLAALLLSAATQGDTVPATPAKPEKKSCRSYGTTGTIMGGKRICHTSAEWNRIDGATAGDATRLHDAAHNANRPTL